MHTVLALLLMAVACNPAEAFVWGGFGSAASRRAGVAVRQMAQEGAEAEPPRPVKDMRAGEIKAELAMRGISFDDCFEKSELVARLEKARSRGIADPNIISEFNKKSLETRVGGDAPDVGSIDDEMLKEMTASDGTLPGGMTPEKMQKLMSNPEVMMMLQNPKLQDLMKEVMSGAPIEGKLAGDPEARELLNKLNALLTS